MALSPVVIFVDALVDFKVVQCRLSNLRKRHAALSILRVNGPCDALTDFYLSCFQISYDICMNSAKETLVHSV